MIDEKNLSVAFEDSRGHLRGVTQHATKALGAVEAAFVDGDIGAIYAPKGRVARALKFTFERGVIARIDIFSDPVAVRALAIAAI